jgi:hypothetical protein
MSGEPGGGTTGASGDSVKGGSGQDINIGHIGSGNVFIGMAEPATLTAVAIYSKAFLEALGSRTGEGVANLAARLGGFMRRRVRWKGGGGSEFEYLIGPDDGSAAIIVVTEDTPDEARLALLDLDVTAPELRGKELYWDPATGMWRPFEGPRVKLRRATPAE